MSAGLDAVLPLHGHDVAKIFGKRTFCYVPSSQILRYDWIDIARGGQIYVSNYLELASSAPDACSLGKNTRI